MNPIESNLSVLPFQPKDHKKLLLIILGLIIIIGIVGFLLSLKFKSNNSTSNSPSTTSTPSAEIDTTLVDGIGQQVSKNCESFSTFEEASQNMDLACILNLSNKGLTNIPTGITILENLELLDLSNNKLSQIPKEIKKLKKLSTLILTGNNFSSVEKDNIKKLLPNVKIIF